MLIMQGTRKQPADMPFLEARGLLRLKQLRNSIEASPDDDTRVHKTSNDVDREFPASELEGSHSVESVTPTVTDTGHGTALNADRFRHPLKPKFEEFLEHFVTENLGTPFPCTLVDFLQLVSVEIFREVETAATDGLIRDMLVVHRVAFLKCLGHPNWLWNSLLQTEQLRHLFLEEILPCCIEAESRVLLTRITMKMFALAVLEEANNLADDFLNLVTDLCRLADFPAIFMWTFVNLLASDEILPYLKGGVTQIEDHFAGKQVNAVYAENSRHLNAPSLLRFRPEPRELKFTPTSGIIPTTRRKIFRTITIKAQQAHRNQSLALDALALCCEMFSSPSMTPSNTKSLTSKMEVSSKLDAQDTPASPEPDENSPSSPPPDATGIPQESPASPDLPEMRASVDVDEKLPDKFYVECKELVMKMTLRLGQGDVHKKTDGRPTYSTVRRALYALGGWQWLAICMIDTLKPEESDKSITWPEFQSVAFFNRNVHIANAFKNNPIWMTLMQAAAACPDAFLYYSPLLRPVYISLYTHWETSMEGPTSFRNMQTRDQTLWMLRCLSQSKLIHEPYCYLGGILEHISPHEISSILASLWKVIKTYMPNPHGLLFIADTEQDFRAKQMAETDCLLKIRAVVFNRLSSIGIVSKKFFTITRVPLEESRWYESTQSQETASAPAPLNTAQLDKVD